MATKKYNYFDQFVQQMSLCKKAAQQLMKMLENYTEVSRQANEIHDTEHAADDLVHQILNELNRSFITPIDREDIVGLVNELDDITDSIEDAANLFDMLSISEIKPEALEMAKLILVGCETLYDAVAEFAHFKTSSKLRELTMLVNKAEEDGDRKHRSFIKAMYLTETDPINLMKWKEIFDMMEKILDDCEDVADLLDGIIIKNS
jgi:predicted phosphate transport protein (TIGR00153 family)